MKNPATAKSPSSTSQAKPKTQAKNAEASKPKTTKKDNKEDVPSKASSSKPTYINMILDAINNLKERQGSSRHAIFKYIIATHELNSKLAHLRGNLAIRNGLANGALKHGKSKLKMIVSLNKRCFIKPI